MNEFCLRTGQHPPTLSAAQLLSHEASPFHKATSQLAAFARARWPLVEYDRVSVQIARMFASAITGEVLPEEAVARAAAVIAGITGLPELGSRRSAWRAAVPGLIDYPPTTRDPDDASAHAIRLSPRR
ncbi:MAG: hypothetical protein C4346_13890 [Chloroflexota bacterium]